MSRIIIIEDDSTIGSTLLSALGANGYDVRWEPTGAEGLALAKETGADLVLLDLGLPDLDGFVVCRELRTLLPEAVIVVLTARQESMDVVSGLESGADDYLTKPFRIVELQARLRAHLRRAHTAESPASASLTVGSLLVDSGSRRATVGGVEIPLRAREFDLLQRLGLEPGRVVGRETLMAEVWDANWFGSTKTLDVHITSLRRKLAAAGEDVPVIRTLRGHGYSLEYSPAAGSGAGGRGNDDLPV
ncbi:response regulator transcription factor [Paenarthrobacter sp. Z7-10]|uniref:response regulator n=1 Tax=Paenarthrobacter sp. Z7-10 TaxID=2787635 RepID=UPI0022A8E0DF|nr:response regulator transcription factor [Paenarthrobacter sp. Z7-10]MCZ2403982.1 response regulator transcription factor [Paenarthrobacter sp. Z7-10]